MNIFCGTFDGLPNNKSQTQSIYTAQQYSADGPFHFFWMVHLHTYFLKFSEDAKVLCKMKFFSEETQLKSLHIIVDTAID